MVPEAEDEFDTNEWEELRDQSVASHTIVFL